MASTASGEAIPLSTLNCFTPRLYMSTIIGYNVKTLSQAGSSMLIEVLQKIVAEMVRQPPVLVGTVRIGPASEGMRMVAHMPVPAARLRTRSSRQSTTSNMWCGDLEAASFAPSKFNIAELCRYPIIPSPDSPQPTFAVQANFVEGGVIISFQLRDAVADGRILSRLAIFISGLLAQEELRSKQELQYCLQSLEAIEIGNPYNLVHGCNECLLAEKSGRSDFPQGTSSSDDEMPPLLLIASASKLENLQDDCN